MGRRVHAEALATFDERIAAGDTLEDACRVSGLSRSTCQRRLRAQEESGHRRRQDALRFSQALAAVTPCLANGCERTVEVPTKGVCYAHYKKLRRWGQYESPDALLVGDRTCRACGETKPLAQFGLHKPSPGGRILRCRECNYKVQKKVNQRHKLLRKYGLTEADYDQMVVEQRGQCLICDQVPSGLHGRLHVDHCHDSGKVRGLLCHGCNVSLGHMRDDPARLESAAAYLRERG